MSNKTCKKDGTGKKTLCAMESDQVTAVAAMQRVIEEQATVIAAFKRKTTVQAAIIAEMERKSADLAAMVAVLERGIEKLKRNDTSDNV
jgi:hypothetical protein